MSKILVFIFFILIQFHGSRGAFLQEFNISSANSYDSTVPEVTTNGKLWILPNPTQQSLGTGLVSAFTMTAVSEIGDKTFFIAVALSLAHSSMHVFGGALFALVLMTLLSVALGLVFSSIPSLLVHMMSSALFLIFGLKMLREGCLMKNTTGKEEFEEVQKNIDNKMASKNKQQDVEAGGIRYGAKWIFLEAFLMTSLAEWGDRSQIATVVLAAKHNVAGVLFGSVLAHAACTLLAVVGGKVVSDRISLRTVTIFGGLLFLAFAVGSLLGAWEEIKSDIST